jgi:2-methylisocitrate lyase-like PEP mutase family enzyme
VYRFAKEAERRGIGCAAFDDRLPINRATAYSVPGVYSKARMIDNIHAAVDGRTDMVLIARCLAPTPNNSYNDMLDRAAAYAEAGADAVWIGLPTAQDYVKAAGMIRKPLMTTIGGANMPATPAAMKAARIAVGNVGSMVNIALGAIDKALVELKATGHMAAAAKGALSREMSDKVEQVEQVNARSRKYNLPSSRLCSRRSHRWPLPHDTRLTTCGAGRTPNLEVTGARNLTTASGGRPQLGQRSRFSLSVTTGVESSGDVNR